MYTINLRSVRDVDDIEERRGTRWLMGSGGSCGTALFAWACIWRITGKLRGNPIHNDFSAVLWLKSNPTYVLLNEAELWIVWLYSICKRCSAVPALFSKSATASFPNEISTMSSRSGRKFDCCPSGVSVSRLCSSSSSVYRGTETEIRS